MNEMVDNPLVREVLGESLVSILGLMSIAADELECEGLWSTMPSGPFNALAPSEMFKGIDTRVYRGHVRELIARFKAGESFEPATEAEVLIGLVHASQVAPLDQGGAALYHHLFRRVMGADVHDALLEGDVVPRERWRGQVAESLHDARKKVKTGRPRKFTDDRQLGLGV